MYRLNKLNKLGYTVYPGKGEVRASQNVQKLGEQCISVSHFCNFKSILQTIPDIISKYIAM